MGFGKMLNNAVSGASSGGSSNRMPNAFLDVREGKRTFRFIPDPSNPQEPLQGEIVLSLWMPVKRAEVMQERRVFIDDSMRKIIPDGLKEKIKRRFFLNVYDRTRVVKLDDGTIVYPNLQNAYFHKDSATQQMKQLTGAQPKPNNTVMVLEGSVSLRTTSSRGGLLNEIDDLSRTIYNEDGTSLIPITSVDIEMVTRGTGLATARSVHPGMNREPFPVDSATLQVYDLASYTRPYPVDAINALLSGVDYNEVMKSYNIPMMPQLISAGTSESDDSIF
jgi:hypothetical protein